MTDSSPYCFISYSRRDTALSRWLQHQLESYKYPVALVAPERRPSDSARLRPVFLDTSDLPTSSGPFWDDICTKIDLSKYLLVLCSRASASSEYVDKEIARFIGQDESRLDKIILAIVDPNISLSSPAIEDFPPEIFRRWSRLSSRNHPLLFTKDGESRSDVRQRGFMQIASFMLGVEWTGLYNRYLIARRKALAWTATIGICVLAAISVSLTWALWKERELTKFESKVFPYSLVVGYTENFLIPLITSLEREPNKPLIIIALPASYEELDHDNRVTIYKGRAEAAGYKAEPKEVKTTLPRGAKTAMIVPTPSNFKDKQVDVYIDFASTVAAFRHVIEYKKTNPAYAHYSENRMLLEYADEFERSVMDELKPRPNEKHPDPDKRQPDYRSRVVFVRSPDAALRVLAGGR